MPLIPLGKKSIIFPSPRQRTANDLVRLATLTEDLSAERSRVSIVLCQAISAAIPLKWVRVSASLGRGWKLWRHNRPVACHHPPPLELGDTVHEPLGTVYFYGRAINHGCQTTISMEPRSLSTQEPRAIRYL